MYTSVRLAYIYIYDRFVFSASSSWGRVVSRRRDAEPSSSAGSMAPVPTRPRNRKDSPPFPSRSRLGSPQCLTSHGCPGGAVWRWGGRGPATSTASVPVPSHPRHTHVAHQATTTWHLPVRGQRTERSRHHPCRDDSHGNGREEPAAIGRGLGSAFLRSCFHQLCCAY